MEYNSQINITFDSIEDAVKALCRKVFGADPSYPVTTVKRELVEYIEACDQVDEKPISDADMVKHVTYIWLSPPQVFYLWLSCLWWKYCARKVTKE